jgi:hypothetical protein
LTSNGIILPISLQKIKIKLTYLLPNENKKYAKKSKGILNSISTIMMKKPRIQKLFPLKKGEK